MPLGKLTGIESTLLCSLHPALTQVDDASQDNQQVLQLDMDISKYSE